MGRPAKQEGQSSPAYTVAVRFQDITGLKAPKGEDGQDQGPLFYEVGEDVSHFEQSRLDEAVARGIIKKNDQPEAQNGGDA